MDPLEYTGAVRFRLTELQADSARGELQIGEGMLNPYGTVNAGVMIWFADVIATYMVMGHTEVQPGQEGFPLAIHFSVDLHSNRREGMLVALSRFVRRGRSLTTVRTRVEDAEGALLLELTSKHLASR